MIPSESTPFPYSKTSNTKVELTKIEVKSLNKQWNLKIKLNVQWEKMLIIIAPCDTVAEKSSKMKMKSKKCGKNL